MFSNFNSNHWWGSLSFLNSSSATFLDFQHQKASQPHFYEMTCQFSPDGFLERIVLWWFCNNNCCRIVTVIVIWNSASDTWLSFGEQPVNCITFCKSKCKNLLKFCNFWFKSFGGGNETSWKYFQKADHPFKLKLKLEPPTHQFTFFLASLYFFAMSQ